MNHPPNDVSAVELQDLSFSYLSPKRVDVLKNLTLTIPDQDFVSIVGPTGCGKTTLLKLIGGLLTSQRNDFLLEGRILVRSASPEEARRRREFGFIFQNPVLLPWRKVKENVFLPLEIIHRGPAHSNDLEELLHMVGLTGFTDLYPAQLSGGMKQRAALARTLIFRPSILLMDEPFGALDEINREKLNLELLNIHHATKATIVLVTHSLQEAAFLSKRIVVLSARPAMVEAEISVDLPPHRSLEHKEHPAFLDLVRRLRGLLKED